jgi:purine-binding chemotaxis protein CheW
MTDHPRGDRSGTLEEDLKLAGFYVGTGLYGIEIMRIKEVIQARPHPIRPVPYAPAIVEGVIQLRGVVIPVVDLRRRFNSAVDPAIEHLNKLIIVSVAGRIAGLKVDRVLGELRVPASSLRPAPSMLRPEAERGGDNIFSGVTRIGGEEDKDAARDRDRDRDKEKDKDRAEMVFVINLDVLLRGSGGR